MRPSMKPKRTVQECADNYAKVMAEKAKVPAGNRKAQHALGLLALDCLLGLN